MTQRFHADFKLTRTLTGRLATAGFPILGLPKRSEEGRRIRGLVRAPRGWCIYSADYNQIELRVAAELSRDSALVAAFQAGHDIHAETAERIFGVLPQKQDDSRHRLPAKAGNFGYWMGLSEKGLTEQIHKEGVLSWSATCPGCKSFKKPHDADCDSAHFFREYDAKYPGAAQFRRDRRAHALETGTAYGMWGMEWRLPGVWSPHEEIREATLRQSHALPISEGAQRLLKQAMHQIEAVDLPWARAHEYRVEPILQIHDELLFCVADDAVIPWNRRVRRTMESLVTWTVPITAKGSAGPSWLEQEVL